jgi:tRNA G18 (ribose-2'-O)-methylase SpoU
MFGQVNSLNVATAAAVALYEVRRQRGSRGGAHLPHSDR